MDEPISRPDITLTLDSAGVIKDVVGSAVLAGEDLRSWHGRPWEDTVSPEAGRRVSRLIETARSSGELSCLLVNQTLPSGRETPIEYTMVNLGKQGGFVAIGRNVQAVADLQSRLADAQQARERDYWRLRDIETRYRALLDASRDAVVLVRAMNLRVVEANVAAARNLRLVPGAECFPDLTARDRKALDSMLDAVRTQGRAPSIVLHLANDSPWSLRASLIVVDGDSFYLFQLASLAGREAGLKADRVPLDEILQRFPEAFAVVDRDGVVRSANTMFLDLVQVGVENAVLGQSLKRWLSQPGADASLVLDMVQRHGSVRRLMTRIEGDLGSSVEVELSAVGDRNGHPDYVAVFLREGGANEPRSAAAEPAKEIALPDSTLEEVIRVSVESIERKSIAEAIAKSNGNRTRAARYLGLSRQSLHAKLKKYRPDLS